MSRLDRILTHLVDYHRIPIDPATVYYLEADGEHTLIRTHRKRLIHDVRSLGEIEPLFTPHHIVRVHCNFMVNLRKVREIKQRPDGDGWQCRLHPPVNLVLSISRTYEKQLWRAFGS